MRPFFSTESFVVPITGLFLGGGVCLLVYILCRGRGLGGGDVKLAAAGGAMIGGDILYALLFACVCAVTLQMGSVDKISKKSSPCGNSAYSFKIFRRNSVCLKNYANHSHFAFVPYMVLGMEIVLLVQIL